MAPEKTFYFLHIPKTAGTTFCFSVLPQVFASSETCPAHDYPDLLPLLADGLERFRLFRGHFYYFFRRLLPIDPVTITFLRDPVERVLSLYSHVCRDPNHYQHAIMPPPPEGLREAVHSHILPPNFQVSSLACDLDPVAVMEEARRASPGGLDEYSVIYSEMIRRTPTRQDLAVACRRLKEMEFTGIVEQFEESLSLLCTTFGWAIPPYRHLNVAPGRTQRAEVKAEVIDDILRANELDLELYDFAKSLLAERADQARHAEATQRWNVPVE